MTWRARGRIFPPSGPPLPDWIGGYGALPFAVKTDARSARVFFSGRDPQNRAQIGACTVDLDTLHIEAASVTAEPLVAPGPPGSFDESGCSMSCVVRQGERWFLYYTGWTLGRTVPFYLFGGLVISDDDGHTFHKHSAAPLLDRTDADPYLTASPSVLIDNGVWRMWYVSGTSWEPRPEGPRHYYLIKYAESVDGIEWRRQGHVAIPFEGDDEYAMGRPHVIRDVDRYRMWFCIRGDKYRIAYAESDDGLTWRREVIQPPERAAWDDAMQAYPSVLQDANRWLMFYNGNSYGATGFGCAVAKSAP
jgi:hypothetical protein